MQIEKLPFCLCERESWKAGNASVGSEGSFFHFVCLSCGRVAQHVSFENDGYPGVFLVTHRMNAGKFTHAESAYVHGPLMTALRFRQMRLEEARRVVTANRHDHACDIVGVARGTTADMVPEEKREGFRQALGEEHEDPNWITPLGFYQPIAPPQVPDSLASAVTRSNNSWKWRWVSVAQTKATRVPLDPIRLKHEHFWYEIFGALRPVVSENFEKPGLVSGERISVVEILNQHHESPHEPWYTFSVYGCNFSVGPHGLVFAVKATFPRDVDLSEIAALAKRDAVTFDTGEGKSVVMHAWSKYTLVEYLHILIRTARRAAASEA